MNVLLDTHALLWWLADDARLSATARATIADRQNVVWVSAASAWEIAIKHRLGKLSDAGGLLTDFPAVLERAGFKELAISTKHAVLAGSLPQEHRDPFDRMLASQALCEGVALVSIDGALDALGANRLW